MVNETLVAQWLHFAKMDLDLAQHTIETMYPPPLEIICYHCQQAAEKYLKGLLVGFDQEPARTHDLGKLLNDLRIFVEIPADLLRVANALTQFGVQIRYPQDFTVDETQTRNAILQAEKVRDWAEGVLAGL